MKGTFSEQWIKKRSKMMTSFGKFLFLPFLLLGVTLLAATIAFQLLVPQYIRQTIDQKLLLVNGSSYYGSWSSGSAPSYTTFRLFHIVNPDEVMRGVLPVHLKEIGPFVFEKIKRQEIIAFHNNETELSFRTWEYYHYRPELSNDAALDQPITTLNLPHAAACGAIISTIDGKWGSWPARKFVESQIWRLKIKLFIKTTPRKFIFEPYDVPTAPGNFTFSLITRVNGTNRGVWRVHTGLGDNSKTGQIISWEGQKSFSCWPGKACNTISGSDGTFFSPPVREDSVFTIFAPELNRSITGHFKEPVVEDQLTKYRFSLFEQDLREQSTRSCYCLDKRHTDSKYCRLDGVIDISACNKKASLVISQPHFFQASSSLREPFRGIKPNRSQHESFFDIDPSLGLVTRGMIRTQTNADLELVARFSPYSDVPKIIFPSYHQEDSIRGESDSLAPIFSYYQTMRLVSIVPFAGYSLAVFVLLFSLVLFLFCGRSGRRTSESCDGFVKQNHCSHSYDLISKSSQAQGLDLMTLYHSSNSDSGRSSTKTSSICTHDRDSEDEERQSGALI